MFLFSTFAHSTFKFFAFTLIFHSLSSCSCHLILQIYSSLILQLFNYILHKLGDSLPLFCCFQLSSLLFPLHHWVVLWNAFPVFPFCTHYFCVSVFWLFICWYVLVLFLLLFAFLQLFFQSFFIPYFLFSPSLFSYNIHSVFLFQFSTILPCLFLVFIICSQFLLTHSFFYTVLCLPITFSVPQLGSFLCYYILDLQPHFLLP